MIPFGRLRSARPSHAGTLPRRRLPADRQGRDAPGKELFVGDTLFAGSIGRTDLPGGDYATLIASIRNVLLPLGDDAVVHSGHGPDTTIGEERREQSVSRRGLRAQAVRLGLPAQPLSALPACLVSTVNSTPPDPQTIARPPASPSPPACR